MFSSSPTSLDVFLAYDFSKHKTYRSYLAIEKNGEEERLVSVSYGKNLSKKVVKQRRKAQLEQVIHYVSANQMNWFESNQSYQKTLKHQCAYLEKKAKKLNLSYESPFKKKITLEFKLCEHVKDKLELKEQSVSVEIAFNYLTKAEHISKKIPQIIGKLLDKKVHVKLECRRACEVSHVHSEKIKTIFSGFFYDFKAFFHDHKRKDWEKAYIEVFASNVNKIVLDSLTKKEHRH